MKKKRSFVEEVTFNKVNQRSGAIHCFYKKPCKWASFQISSTFGML